MLKKSITYTDFNGETRTEDKYFNLTKAELTELELNTEGGLSEKIKKITDSAKPDVPSIVKLFKQIILLSYGEKSEDGISFIKTEEARKRFEQSEAYSELFMELISDDKAAAKFINGVIPKIEGTPDTHPAKKTK